MDIKVVRKAAVEPQSAVDMLAAFIRQGDGLVHTDTLTQLQLVQQSISETYAVQAAGVSSLSAPPNGVHASETAAPSAAEEAPPSKKQKKAPEAAPAAAPPPAAAEPVPAEAKEQPDKKAMKKLAKKALKKLAGGCGTCDEVCAAARKIDGTLEAQQLAELMGSALKALLKKEDIKKTGEKREGQPVYALSGGS